MLATHDLTEYLKLFKELYQREKMYEKTGKKQGQVDSRYQDKVEKLLSEEFAAALHITPDAAKKKCMRQLIRFMLDASEHSSEMD